MMHYFFPLLSSQGGDNTDLDWYCWVCKMSWYTVERDAGQGKYEACTEELA